MAVKKAAEEKAAEKKPVEKKVETVKAEKVEKVEKVAKVEKAPAKKPAEKKPAAKKPAAKKTAEVIIQSPLGGEITGTEILKRVGDVDKVYVRVDENKAYWVRGEESGSVDLW